MLIESGTGNGKLAGVDDDNRVLTASFNIPFPHLIAKDYQKTFAVFGTSTTITTANSYSVLYLENNTENSVFVLNRAILQAIVTGPTFPSTGEYFTFETDSAYDTGGTVVTPVNLSSGSSVTSGALSYETNFALLNAPNVADVIYPPMNGALMDFVVEGGIILLPGKAFSIGYTSGAGTGGFAKASMYFSVVSADGYSG
jgi:hypothetical protein